MPGGISDYLPPEVVYVDVRCSTSSGQPIAECSYDSDDHATHLMIDALAADDTVRMEIDVRYPPPLGNPVDEIHNCAEINDGSDDDLAACAITTVES
jgi:hypothetical protein